MNTTPALKLAAPLLAALLAACGDMDPSTEIPTQRIYARFVAETQADGTSAARADFFEKDNELFRDGEIRYEGVYLAGGDTLDVRTEEHRLLFTGGGSHFEGALPSGIVEDTVFTFDLQRPQHADAPGSWGSLPAPMDLWLPQAGTEYSVENDELMVAWNYGGTIDDMWLGVEAQCIEPAANGWIDDSFTVDIPGDPGLFAVDLSDRVFFSDDCRRYAATLTLYRARAGELDDAYKPDEETCGDEREGDCSQRGYVSIRQVRSVEIVLTP